MKRKEELSAKNLTVLAIATSIDALAVGVSFAFLGISIVQTIIIIGIITFVLCGYSIIFVHFIENITREHINKDFTVGMNKRKERLGV